MNKEYLYFKVIFTVLIVCFVMTGIGIIFNLNVLVVEASGVTSVIASLGLLLYLVWRS